jgi:hypothetical protein
MFVFHHALSAIGVIDAEDINMKPGEERKCVLLATVDTMRKAGWKVNDGDLRKVLPRIDKPSIVI